MNSRSLLIAMSVAALLPVGAALAQDAPASAPAPAPAPAAAPAVTLDGAYKGTMVCPLPGNRVLRAPMEVIVNSGSVLFARPIFNGNNQVFGSEIGTGTVEGNAITMKSSGFSAGAHYETNYKGTLTAEGGLLAGTQAWSVGEKTQTRPCTIAFVKLHA